ncbi:MAG: substrate-binding domain-containing protein [Verrucomicrobiae bacterium]|nr:substrate-binding domain-containing protein [Verrucomicrobiae bacterium]
MARYNPPAEGMPTDVILDHYHFGQECVKLAAQRGVKRIVYLRTVASDSQDLDGIYDAVAELKLPKAEVCQLRRSGENGAQTERMAHEKVLEVIKQRSLRSDGKSWPDALLVSDDVATRGVALALLQSGMGVSKRQPLVVTMANKEIVHHYGIPVTRYEFSVQEIARELVRLLWLRILHKAEPDLPVKVRGKIEQE